MTRGSRGRPPLLALAIAVALGLGVLGAPPPGVAAEPSLPAWDGGVDLYRDGVFTTQKSWLWCTAAGVQIVRNIVDEAEDHSASGQRRYFNWMREHNRYTLPLSAGVDPAGLDGRSPPLRRRSLPAGLQHDLRRGAAPGRQADPPDRAARRPDGGPRQPRLDPDRVHRDRGSGDDRVVPVSSVRVVGPLFGLQSRNGYDMPPDTELTPAQLKRYFTPWRYAPQPMIWDGRYVSIQPVPAAKAPTATAAAAAEPSAAAVATPARPVRGEAVPVASSGAGPPVSVAHDEGHATTSTGGSPQPMVALAAALAAVGVGVLAWLVHRTRRGGSRREAPRHTVGAAD